MSSKLVIKIGTNALTNDHGELDQGILQNLVAQIAELQNHAYQIILVTSGAVGAGKSHFKATSELSKIESRQVYASIGQISLMHTYQQLFAKHGLFCAQVLATKEDFRDQQHYFNMRMCFESLFKEKVIPIVNENDVVAIDELMFTDNDELAGLIGAMMNVDGVVILSNINGLYDQNPKNPEAKLLAEIDFKKIEIESFINKEKSTFGRGGMITKAKIAKRLSSLGITTYIANGKNPNIITEIFKANSQAVYTKFLPFKKASNLKKRIAYLRGFEKGTIYLNHCAVEKLKEDKIMSILPVGISKVEGEFEKGDVIKICSEQKKFLGIGIAQYNNEIVLSSLGQKNKRPTIHYDYLYLEP